MIRSVKEGILGSEVISIDLVKAFLKISNSAQDELLKELLSMSIQYAEWYMEKSLIKQKWKIIFVGIIPKILFIPFGPIINVNKIDSYYNNQYITLTQNIDYKVHNIGNYIEFIKISGEKKLEITYISGYEKEELIPANIKEGILKHVFYVYHQNQDDEKMRQIRKVYEAFKDLKVVL